MISEGPGIVQYVADKNPGAGIIPAAGSIDRYHFQGWLTHIGTELHKTYGPMFRPTTPDEYKKISKETLANKYKNVDKMLEGKQYLMGGYDLKTVHFGHHQVEQNQIGFF